MLFGLYCVIIGFDAQLLLGKYSIFGSFNCPKTRCICFFFNFALSVAIMAALVYINLFNIKYYIVLLLMVGLVFHSCSQDATGAVEESAVPKQVVNHQMEQLARVLSQLPLSLEVLTEVHQAVVTSQDLGLEESYYFQEILGGEASGKIVRGASSKQSLLGKLLEKHQSQLVRSSNAREQVDLEELANSDVQIYWPYSEDWDGKTAPVITFVPEDDSQMWNYGFVFQKGRIDTIIVTEELAERRPVWVINKADLAYKDLPQLAMGELAKNNTLYASKTNKTKRLKSAQIRGEDYIYTVSVGKMMSSRQHDSFWAGGSEYYFLCGSPSNFSLIEGTNRIAFSPKITKFLVYRSRKDIRKKRWVDVNLPLVDEWTDDLTEAAIMLLEEDQGRDKNWDKEVSVNFLGKKYKVSVSLPFNSEDDMLYQNVHHLNYFRSTSNINHKREWKLYHVDGVNWTMPCHKNQIIN
ncbi:MAG: hypothetical protein Q4A44_03885 [Bacteroidales bacterium]|nr:hypothetical protein [Bacteroidales bacterium]